MDRYAAFPITLSSASSSATLATSTEDSLCFDFIHRRLAINPSGLRLPWHYSSSWTSPPAKIMILSPWSLNAFLVYIRPQVLKWTHNRSCNMIYLDSFFDAASRNLVTFDDPRTRKRLQQPFNGRNSIVTMLKFYSYH
jgi:hypothetical protein